MILKNRNKDEICWADEKSGLAVFSGSKKVYYYVKAGNKIYCWEKINHE